LLAFDTTAEILSIALMVGDKNFSMQKEIGLTHGEVLPVEVRSLMERAGVVMQDLSGVICSRGPGSFTGLRIGMSFAKGLAAALNIPTISVSLFSAYAQAYANYPGLLVPVIDGKKQRFYGELFSRGTTILGPWDRTTADTVELIEQQCSNLQGHPEVLLTGPHCMRFANIGPLPGHWRVDNNPAPIIAAHMIQVALPKFDQGDFDAEETGPDYLRESQAVEDRI
jgi:tRNA threonylcarbamoyladenosine biosynthesis protein TsaB